MASAVAGLRAVGSRAAATGLFPLRFKVEEDRSAFLCACKATSKPPYCDGTHKSNRVQNAQEGSSL